MSTLGDSVYQLAIVWYMYELTQSPLFTGLTIACMTVPNVFSFLFGPMIDRANKQFLLAHAQLIQAILMTVLPISLLLGYEHVGLVLAVAFCIAFFENFQGTAEISIAPQLVGKEDLGHFNSVLNGSSQVVNLLMTGLFSIVLVYLGIIQVYLFVAIAFFAAFLCFAFIRREGTNRKTSKNTKLMTPGKGYKKELKEGFAYVKSTRLLIIMLPFVLANGLLSGVQAVLPDYAQTLGSTTYYGWLMFSISIGLVVGSLGSSLILRFPVGKLFVILPFLTGILWLCSLLQQEMLLSFILFGLSFVPFGMMNIVFITLVQQSVDSALLSRVLSLCESILVLSIPGGALLGGFIASLLGPQLMMFASAAAFAIIGLFFLVHPFLRALPALDELTLHEESKTYERSEPTY
nr:MFS transporter [Aureibacillus halotolerans]